MFEKQGRQFSAYVSFEIFDYFQKKMYKFFNKIEWIYPWHLLSNRNRIYVNVNTKAAGNSNFVYGI